jgi:hypothetical protein
MTTTRNEQVSLDSVEAAEQLAAASTDERVTRFPVRDVDLPGGAGTLALITMDNGFDHTKPTTFGPKGLLNLRATLDEVTTRARSGEIVAVGFTGRPVIFAV